MHLSVTGELLDDPKQSPAGFGGGGFGTVDDSTGF